MKWSTLFLRMDPPFFSVLNIFSFSFFNDLVLDPPFFFNVEILTNWLNETWKIRIDSISSYCLFIKTYLGIQIYIIIFILHVKEREKLFKWIRYYIVGSNKKSSSLSAIWKCQIGMQEIEKYENKNPSIYILLEIDWNLGMLWCTIQA